MAIKISAEDRQAVNDAWNKMLKSVGVRPGSFLLADAINNTADEDVANSEDIVTEVGRASQAETDLAARALALETWRNNRVVSGINYTAPTTPAAQPSGANPASWRYNLVGGLFVLSGTTKAHLMGSPSYADLSVCDPAGGSPNSPILAVGQSVITVFVGATYSSSVIGITSVVGTPATTGQQVVPTDAEILVGLTGRGYSAPYIRVAKLTLNRTGDTTVTQSQDNTWRDF